MVNNGNNQFSSIPNNVPDKKIYIYYSQFHILMEQFLIGCSPDWIFFLENDNKKQKQKTQQMFYKFDNFCIYIKKVFGNQNKNKAIEKQFLILKQTQ